MLFTFSTVTELLLSILLAATLFYCAVLERRLSHLRKGQDGLKETIGRLNEAITAAGASMRMLKSTAAGAAEELEEKVSKARGLADELSLLTVTGERIASRISERSGSQQVRSAGPMPESLSTRLEALKTVRPMR